MDVGLVKQPNVKPLINVISFLHDTHNNGEKQSSLLLVDL